MDTMIAYCGIDCAACDARKATLTNDDALRAKTAAKWNAAFGFPADPALVECVGCSGDGAKIGHCAECDMRLCAMAKGLATCAGCAEFEACERICRFLADVPEARANLALLRG